MARRPIPLPRPEKRLDTGYPGCHPYDLTVMRVGRSTHPPHPDDRDLVADWTKGRANLDALAQAARQRQPILGGIDPKQPKLRFHNCAMVGCRVRFSGHIPFCGEHWGKLPIRMRGEIMTTYKIGQTDATALPAWHEALAKARTVLEGK